MGLVLRKLGANPRIFFLLALWILWGSGYKMLWNLRTEVEGTVISAKDIPWPLASGQHATEYLFRSPGGQTFPYVARPTDPSLPGSIAVGTYIKKQRWHLSYNKDGKQINDFGILFYAGSLTIAAGCLMRGIRLFKSEWETRKID